MCPVKENPGRKILFPNRVSIVANLYVKHNRECKKKKKEEPKKQNWTPPTLNVYCSKMGILPGTTKHNKKCKSKKNA